MLPRLRCQQLARPGGRLPDRRPQLPAAAAPGRGALAQVGRKAVGRDDIAGRVDQGVLDDALQFADVARPGVLLEKLHGLGRHAVHAAVEFAVHAAEEVVHQQGDVVDPLAERRNADRQHVEPVEQVLAEAAGGGQRFQVLVGGGDEADVGVDRGVAADALELLFLQQPQQLGLRGRRHVADFVHEDACRRRPARTCRCGGGRRR